MRRVIGMDIHRTFAEVVVWEDGRLRHAGRVDMTRTALEGFGKSLKATDEIVVDPRVVPSFHYHSFLACRPLRPRGARSSLCPVPRCRHGPSPRVERLGAPKYPAIRFTRELVFVALRFASATACQVARPPVRI